MSIQIIICLLMNSCFFLYFYNARLLGLCNNYGYVVMLSAAYDILEKKEGSGGSNKNATVRIRSWTSHHLFGFN